MNQEHDQPVRNEQLAAIAAICGKSKKSLSDYHAMGKIFENAAKVSGGQRQGIAKTAGVSVSTMNKCLQFRTLYNEHELNELEKLGVGWAVFSNSFAISDKQKRHALLRRASSEGWNGRQSQQEIQEANQHCRGGGRNPQKAVSRGCVPDIRGLIRRTNSWLDSFCAWKTGRGRHGPAVEQMMSDQLKWLEKDVEKATILIGQMRDCCQEFEKDIEMLKGRIQARLSQRRR